MSCQDHGHQWMHMRGTAVLSQDLTSQSTSGRSGLSLRCYLLARSLDPCRRSCCHIQPCYFAAAMIWLEPA